MQNLSAAVHIGLEHQSAPKETETDKLIRSVASDIMDGKFVPEITDEFWDVGMSALVAQHPAVQERIASLQTEIQHKTNAEYLEKAHMLFEMTEEYRKRFRWVGQERWQGAYNEASRLVNPITPSQFIEKLQAIGISAEADPPEVTVSLANPAYNPFTVGGDEPTHIDMRIVKSDKKIYLGNRVIGGRVALNAKVYNPETHTIQEMRVNTLQVPLGPEWSVMRFDEYGVVTNEKYHGWRTALLSLITKGVITKDEAHRAFGKPKGEASGFYRQQLFEGGY